MAALDVRETHPVSIKVMRLYTPLLSSPPCATAADSFGTLPPATTDTGTGKGGGAHGGSSGDGVGGTSADALSLPSGVPHASPHASLLRLPEGFGSIYSGQKFCSYISVLNHSDVRISAVTLTAELQAEGARKFALVDRRGEEAAGRSHSAEFPPGESLDMVVEHYLTNVGAHILRVCVEYVDPVTQAPKEYRKFYKFAVQDPLSFNYKWMTVPSAPTGDGSLERSLALGAAPAASEALEGAKAALQGGKTFVELQISNATPHLLSLSSLDFQCVQGLVARRIGPAPGAEPDPLDVDGEQLACPVVSPGDVAVLVYEVSIDPSSRTDAPVDRPAPSRSGGVPWQPSPRLGTAALGTQSSVSAARGSAPPAAVEIGKFSTVWRMQMGEQGVWLSLPLMLRAPTSQPVTLAVKDLPASMEVDEAADVVCLVTNRSSTPQAATLIYAPTAPCSGLVVQGRSSRALGVLQPGESTSVSLSVLACSPGWHLLEGIKVFDPSTKQVLATLTSSSFASSHDSAPGVLVAANPPQTE